MCTLQYSGVHAYAAGVKKIAWEVMEAERKSIVESEIDCTLSLRAVSSTYLCPQCVRYNFTLQRLILTYGQKPTAIWLLFYANDQNLNWKLKNDTYRKKSHNEQVRDLCFKLMSIILALLNLFHNFTTVYVFLMRRINYIVFSRFCFF